MDGPSGQDFSWKAFMVFFVILAVLMAVMDMFWDKGDPVMLAANELCQKSMPEVPAVNGTLGSLGVKQGWWEAEAVAKDKEVLHVVCKRADVRTLGTVE